MGKGTRTALVALTALIVLICIYCLSFTFKVNSIEKEAIALAEKAIPMQDLDKRYPGNQLAQFLYEDSIHQSRINHKNRYLDSISNEKVYLWNTYKACKEQQLNLGLDLQGGMSVVLQVSLKELLSTLADNSRDPKFNKALDVAEQRMSSANNDYVSLFLEAYKEQNPTTTLAQLFSTRNNKEDINAESSNSDVEKFIRAKAKEAFDVTLNRLTTRIDQFGTKQPTITSEPARERISVEIAGVDNPARVRKLLQATANLEFWETYKATEIGKSLNDANTVLKNYLDTQKDLGKDSAVMSKAQSLLTASTDSSAEAVNPLSGKKDTSKLAKKDTSQAKRFEEFKNENPLFAVLQPAVDENNQFQASPIIGYVSTLDTAKLTEYLTNPDVRSVFPKDLDFSISAKSFGDKQKFFTVYAIKRNTNDGNAPLDGSVVTQARQDY
ncbi:MAG TPA: hypothetical protein PKA75_04875, partial [Chitinophagales bacterium]|nr:hypothetical protein [Chitinophagales bacterium]